MAHTHGLLLQALLVFQLLLLVEEEVQEHQDGGLAAPHLLM
jgi:hypothetical protein